MSSLSNLPCTHCHEETVHRYGVCIHCGTSLAAAPAPKPRPFRSYRIGGLKQLALAKSTPAREPKRCKECGGPIDSTLTYCGDECREKAREGRYGQRTRVCPVCGETYRLRGADDTRKRSCSTRCGQKLRRDRERADNQNGVSP